MKAQPRYTGNIQEKNPVVQIKEKRLKHLQRLLGILKDWIIQFPPLAPKKARRHYLSHNNTLNATTRPPTSRAGSIYLRALSEKFK